MKKRTLLAFVICFLFLPDLTHAFTYNSKEFQSIISQLDMQGHADDELSTCKVKQVYYEEVLEMLNGGKNEEEIIQSYVDEYGQAALRTPGSGKSGLVAWGMPAAAFLAGAAIVFYWLRKLTRNNSKTAENETVPDSVWPNETEKDILEKTYEEERRKLF